MTTIKDIAKKAGVSTATVSRIINGKGEASSETIERVMQIISETNYRPNRLAKTLSQKSSNIVAVMVPNLDNPFFGELITEIGSEAAKNDIQLLICDTGDSRQKVEMFLESIINNYAFGAIICTLHVTADDLQYLEEHGVNTVTTDRSFLEHPYSAVDIDQKNGGYLATQHLIERGAKNIIFLSGKKEDLLNVEREEGYLAALKNANLSFSYVLYGDYSLESGYQVIKSCLEENREIDGIWAANDLMAIGAMRACRDLQKDIPGEIKIVGNDNLKLCSYLTPKLTSLSQNKTQIGQAVINELISLKNRKSISKKIMIQPELIVRETT